ncbi:hypothetical protein BR93DRAFT_89765 [Coniochaeta sp. PMI_546]|nr:hypothetical protein BR93DRAFT_89765 [Coniochaeta sp. PMI_546]
MEPRSKLIQTTSPYLASLSLHAFHDRRLGSPGAECLRPSIVDDHLVDSADNPHQDFFSSVHIKIIRNHHHNSVAFPKNYRDIKVNHGRRRLRMLHKRQMWLRRNLHLPELPREDQVALRYAGRQWKEMGMESSCSVLTRYMSRMSGDRLVKSPVVTHICMRWLLYEAKIMV